ncbi:cerebellin-1-like [Osmerus mordax]|uniref:cerebellin-1-like n=1 Tax=Osmerus mordax TaxID=8014 RepID=UPI0035108C9D
MSDGAILTELRALRDMVVAQKVERTNMENRMTASQGQVEELKTEVVDQRVQLSVTQTQLQFFKDQLSVTQSQVEEMRRENTAQAADIVTLKTRLTASEGEGKDLQTENLALEARLSLSERHVEELKAENEGRPKVAFYTALTDSGAVGPYRTDTPLVYSKVFTNIGNPYSPVTGVFTAPVRGVYYFRFTAADHRNSETIGVYMYKNDLRIMFNSGYNTSGQWRYVANAVTLELEQGDRIMMHLPRGRCLYDNSDNYNTFSGFLLFPM